MPQAGSLFHKVLERPSENCHRLEACSTTDARSTQRFKQQR
ncbi:MULTISPECIES: hypothetical protein [unclassified Moorena]|nr:MULTISPECIES: hypothetical protein [unclassified Moorena]